MKKGIALTAILIALSGLLATLVILLPKLQVSHDSQTLGSVPQFNEYHSTTTRSVAGLVIGTPYMIQSGQGALGSVIITGIASGIMNFYDATSTQTNFGATTTLAMFPTNAATGTYTFDAIYQRGLLIETVGNVATSTITYR